MKGLKRAPACSVGDAATLKIHGLHKKKALPEQDFLKSSKIHLPEPTEAARALSS